MLNKSELERAIRVHEQKANDSYESCEKLAHLYALYDRYYADAQPSKATNSVRPEVNNIFPALSEYQNTRSISDFRALCNEVEQFCNAVYVSTTSDETRKIYKNMVEHLQR